MIIFGILAASVLLGGGLFILLNAVLNTPSKKAKQAVKKSNSRLEKKELMEYLEPILLFLAKPLSKIIPLNPYKEREMAVMLEEAEMPYTPKVYIAKNIAIALLVSLLSIPLFYVFPIGGFALIGIGVILGLDQQSKVYGAAKKRREIIEAELPRFTQHIALAVKNTTNVTGMLEVYRPMAGKTFGKELTKTIADIRTSDVQGGLKRLSRRVNSTMLNEVVRGLCSIDQGIDQGTHFQLLAFTYRDRQNQLLKKEALKRPDKISTCTLLGLGAMLVQIIAIIGTQLMNQWATFNI